MPAFQAKYEQYGDEVVFLMVNLTDGTQETRESAKAFYENSGYTFPSAELTVNLAPASRRKEGTGLDLSILLAILRCAGYIDANVPLNKCCFVGELSLSGNIRGVCGVLSMCAGVLTSTTRISAQNGISPVRAL